MKTETTYPSRFAGPRRDSAIPALVTAKGVRGFSTPLDLPGEVEPSLLVWDGNLLVNRGGRVALFAPDGKRRWEHDKHPNSPVAVANGLLYMETAGHTLEAITLDDGTALRDAPFPGVPHDEVHVRLLWPREKDFIATLALPDPKYDSETTKSPPPPKVSGRRTIYGERIGAWGVQYEGEELLPGLFIPETERWIVCLGEVISVDMKSGEEARRFKIPVERVLNWSADAAGNLYVIGGMGAHKVLMAMAPAGRQLWWWMDVEGSDRWVPEQPPILGPAAAGGGVGAGRAYAITPGRVIAIEQGKSVWEYSLKAEAIGHGAQLKDGALVDPAGRRVALEDLRFGSALSDGSLLVTADKTLRHLSPAGKLVWSVSLDRDIVTPPVVTADGTVYVATASDLVQIR